MQNGQIINYWPAADLILHRTVANSQYSLLSQNEQRCQLVDCIYSKISCF